MSLQMPSRMRPTHLLRAGVAIALALSNAWPVHAAVGSCGTHSIFENGWPFQFLRFDWSLPAVLSFSPLELLLDLVAAGLLILLTWPIARRMERWLRGLPVQQALVAILSIAPIFFVAYLRWTEFPWNIFLLVVAIPIIAGIAHGVCESLQAH